MTGTSTDNYFFKTWLDISSASELFKQQSVFQETIQSTFFNDLKMKEPQVERVKKVKDVIFFDPKNLDV